MLKVISKMIFNFKAKTRLNLQFQMSRNQQHLNLNQSEAAPSHVAKDLIRPPNHVTIAWIRPMSHVILMTWARVLLCVRPNRTKCYATDTGFTMWSDGTDALQFVTADTKAWGLLLRTELLIKTDVIRILKRMKHYNNLLTKTYQIQLVQGTAVTDIV